jgi:hypothetical protein
MKFSHELDGYAGPRFFSRSWTMVATECIFDVLNGSTARWKEFQIGDEVEGDLMLALALGRCGLTRELSFDFDPSPF